MGFFSGAFKGQSNDQVLRGQQADYLTAHEARQNGRRDRDAEARVEAASKEMQSRYREENANPEAALLIDRWGRKR